jgi:hypothetical protein
MKILGYECVILKDCGPFELRKYQAPKLLNPKSQNSNIKQIPMTQIQNSKQLIRKYLCRMA